MPHRIIAIPTYTAARARTTGRSPGYGHPTHREVATGHGPCRHCLRTFRIGAEDRILFTFDAFHGIETLPLPGPVFIHAETCDRYPDDAGFPPDLRAHPLTLSAYARGRVLQEVAYASGTDAEREIDRMMRNPAVSYIQVHDTEAGCFDFRVEPE